MKIDIKTLLASVIVAGVAAGAVSALMNSQSPAASKAISESDFKAMLMDNPQTILDSLDAYRAEIEKKEQAPVSDDLRRQIEDTNYGQAVVLAGPADAEIVLVKFNDPNCSFCRRSIPEVKKVIEAFPEVKVVVRPFPILGPNSVATTHVGTAIADLGAFEAFYSEVSNLNGPIGQDKAMRLAEEIGVDTAALRAELAAGDIANRVNANLELGLRANVQGTPTFFLNGKPIRGAMPFAGMKQEIEAIQAQN
jgi:protein-disulfide isomerase